MKQIQPPLHYAGLFSRLIAFTLDLIIIGVIIFLFSAFVGMIFNFFGMDNILNLIGRGRDIIPATVQSLIVLASSLFGTLFSLVYFLFFWTEVGFTPGKGLLGLRIVRVDGQRIKFGAAVLRLIGYWLSALFLFLGFVWIIVDRRRQGWHDKLSRTVVIYDWRSRNF